MFPSREDHLIFCRPCDYLVIDGDTFAIMSYFDERGEFMPARRDAGGQPLAHFRVRLPNVDTAELRMTTIYDAEKRALGIDPDAGSVGDVVKKEVQSMVRDRALFIHPQQGWDGTVRDRYDRVLAHVVISGSKGNQFNPIGSRSLEIELLERNLAIVMEGREYPPHTSPVIDQILRDNDEREMLESISSGPAL